MQAASHGVRAIRGHAPHVLPGTKLGTSRSIHTSSAFRLSPLPHATHHAPTSFAQRLVSQSKTAVGRYFALLTAPARVGVTTTPTSFRNVAHLATSNVPPIHQTFSIQARQAVGRPFGAYRLPKAPALTPRPVSQVGLGTARNFHSSRPLFQNFVDNAPISLRAFTEADWELESKGKQPVKMTRGKGTPKAKKTKEMAKPVENKVQPVPEIQAEFDRYFTPAPAEVITNLLVPLKPTPSSRQPLHSNPSPPIFPFSILLEVHASHELHSLRVSSLFSRLDVARVWDDSGVSCLTYGDPSGLASIMKIEFQGWNKAQVMAVLGEAGKGWCMIEECGGADDLLLDSAPPSPSLSGFTSPISGYSTPTFGLEEENPPEYDVDPSNSLVIPSLELSFCEVWEDSPRMPEHIDVPGSSSCSDLDSDNDSDTSLEYDRHSDCSDPDSTGFGWMMMSSRIRDDEVPREWMF